MEQLCEGLQIKVSGTHLPGQARGLLSLEVFLSS